MEHLLTKLHPILQRQQRIMAIQAKLLRGKVDEILEQRSMGYQQNGSPHG